MTNYDIASKTVTPHNRTLNQNDIFHRFVYVATINSLRPFERLNITLRLSCLIRKTSAMPVQLDQVFPAEPNDLLHQR